MSSANVRQASDFTETRTQGAADTGWNRAGLSFS
jgi:hypothetical protein